jgi:antitoxin component YwqK of YwqJK toxin-antitoxin module
MLSNGQERYHIDSISLSLGKAYPIIYNKTFNSKGINIEKAITGFVYKRFPNGNLEIENYYKDGNPDSLHRSWYENGQLKKEQFYQNKALEGPQYEYYENGQLKSSENFRNNRKIGIQKYFSSNGTILGEANLIDGNGNIILKNDSGSLVYEENYENGLLEKISKYYYQSGKLKCQVSYKEGTLDGVYTKFYETGKKDCEYEYSKGIKNGTYKSWYEDETPKDEGTYKDGNLFGLYKTWHPNGKLKTEVNFSSEYNISGELKSWWKNGQLKTIQNFNEGILTGEQFFYSPRGKLIGKGNLKNGYGTIKINDESGRLISLWKINDNNIDQHKCLNKKKQILDCKHDISVEFFCDITFLEELE